MRLEGRVAVITGGAQGIGAAYARRFAAEGAKVAIADIDKGTEIVKEIKAAGGDPVDVPPDVADETSCNAMVAKTVSAFGRLDILINNAAVFTTLTRQPFTEIPVEVWDKVMAVNTRGVFLASKAAVAP